MAMSAREKSLRRAAERAFSRRQADEIAKTGDILSSRVARLKWAVQQAGGHKTVCERSGINGRTLSHLLAGQDIKAEQLLQISKATGFSVEWLVTGRSVEIVELSPIPAETVAGSGDRDGRDLYTQVSENMRKSRDLANALDISGDLTDPDAEGATPGPVYRLTLAVQEAGGVAAVARRAKLNPAVIRDYLAGFQFNHANLPKLAEATGFSAEWLASGTGPRRPGIVPTGEEPHTAGMLTRTPGTVLIARYDTRAAAGPNHLLDPGTIIENISFSADWVRTVLRRNPAHLALIECSGDSMEPTLRDGDVLMVDTSVTEVQSSRIYVLDVDGALLVKRIQRMLNGSYRVISDNPRYATEVVEPSDRAPLRIVGEVVWQSGLARS